MSCPDFRHLIHLDVGNDLHAEQEHELAGHMERCADCREYHSQTLRSMSALQVLRDFDAVAMPNSRQRGASWSALVSRLPPRIHRVTSTRRFNFQVAALSVCSVAMAVVTIVQTLPISNVQPITGGVPVRLAAHAGQWDGGLPLLQEFRGSDRAGMTGQTGSGHSLPEIQYLPETPVNLSPVPLPLTGSGDSPQSF